MSNQYTKSILSFIYSIIYYIFPASVYVGNQSYFSSVKPHSSVGSIAYFSRGRWFNPRLGQYSFWGLMIVIATGFIPLTTVPWFDNSYVGKQPVAWKEYWAEYWLKELQESTDRCTGCCNVTEILLKTDLNTIQSINLTFLLFKITACLCSQVNNWCFQIL